jgi:small subunit ribosomal protein S20
MPIIKSAKKRVRVAEKAAIRNSKTKRILRGALKIFARKATSTAHVTAQSAIDVAAKKGIVHKNKAARLKKQIAAKSKAAGVKVEAAKKTAATKATKPAAAKKATPEKAVNAPAKKPATKKTPAKK